MKKFLKFLVVFLIVAAFAVLIGKRIMKPAEEIQTKELPAVTVTHMTTGNIEKTTALIGTIQPSDTYYVMPKAAGEITEVLVENGQSVQAGQALCRIDNQKQIDAAKFTLEQTQIQVRTAQAALARMTPLYQSGDISQQDYENTKAQVDAAAAQQSSAQLNYDTQVEFSTVTAPNAGTIQNSSMTVHATVAQSSQLCIITGTGAKTVDFNVTEDVQQSLAIGEAVTVDKQGNPYHGSISDIGAVVNPQTGLFPVEATLDDASSLPDGASAKVTLVTKRSDGVNLIPIDCIYYAAGEAFVYGFDDGKISKHVITIGIQNDEFAEVLSGIDADTQIVNSWTDELYDGATVRLADK